jgi:hypothetical protein
MIRKIKFPVYLTFSYVSTFLFYKHIFGKVTVSTPTHQENRHVKFQSFDFNMSSTSSTCKARNFFPEFNIRLYDKFSESDYFFFPPPKSEYFFQQHWESEYFFRNMSNSNHSTSTCLPPVQHHYLNLISTIIFNQPLTT